MLPFSTSLFQTGGAVSGTSASSTIPVHVQTISPSKQILKPAGSTTTIHPIQLSTAGGKMPLMRILSVTTGTTTSTSGKYKLWLVSLCEIYHLYSTLYLTVAYLESWTCGNCENLLETFCKCQILVIL